MLKTDSERSNQFLCLHSRQNAHYSKDHILNCMCLIKWTVNLIYRHNLEITGTGHLNVDLGLGRAASGNPEGFTSPRGRTNSCVPNRPCYNKCSGDSSFYMSPWSPRHPLSSCCSWSPQGSPPAWLSFPDNAQIPFLSLCALSSFSS